jgi:KDO2-lipid IV(A) lauroyltransferase
LESYIVYLLSRFALSSVRHLRRSRAIRLLDFLASLTYRLDAVHRHIARVNLTIAFPELSPREHDVIARQSFQSSTRNLLEISHMPELTSSNIRSLVEYDPQLGLNNYEIARLRRKGILYLTGHFSAWELLPKAHAVYGYPLSFVTRPLDNEPLERYLFNIRQMAGNRVIYKKNSVRQILERLKTAGEVGILMDQNTSLQEGIFVEFFGLPAATSTSVALLALRTEASVLPGYLTPSSGGCYTIKFLPPVDMSRTGDTTRDVAVNTQRLNGILEGIIREQPGTWLWGHRRWKNQPEGCPDLYRLSEQELRGYLANKAAARQNSEPGY